MKKILFCILGLMFNLSIFAQYKITDFSLATIKPDFKDSIAYINKLPESTEKAMLELRACWYYFYANADSSIYYAKRVEAYTQKADLKVMNAYIHLLMGQYYVLLKSNAALGLYYSDLALTDAEKYNFSNPAFEGHLKMIQLGCYSILGSYTKVKNLLKGDGAKAIRNAYNKTIMWTPEGMIGYDYSLVKEYDSAIKYSTIAVGLNKAMSTDLKWGFPYYVLGNSYLQKKEYRKSIDVIHSGLSLILFNNFEKDIAETYEALAESYYGLKQMDSATYFARAAFQLAKKVNYSNTISEASGLLATIFKERNAFDSAYKYLEISNQIKIELSDKSKINDAENITLNDELRQKQKQEYNANKFKLIVGLSLFFIIGFTILFFINKQKQKNKIRQVEEERKNKELQAARDLQMCLLPRELPKRKDLQIATFLRSSTEVGGDYYDFEVQDDGTILSFCGDATGHGVASGMMVSVTKAGLKGIGHQSPGTILQKLNNIIKDVELGILRMSLNIVKITSSAIEFSSAAMPPIYLFSNQTKKVEELLNVGLPLGGLRNESFNLNSRKFESGDILIQLTDGLPEAQNLHGELYDYERISKLLSVSAHLSAQEIINVLIRSVDEWMGDKHNQDDITLVVIKKQ